MSPVGKFLDKCFDDRPEDRCRKQNRRDAAKPRPRAGRLRFERMHAAETVFSRGSVTALASRAQVEARPVRWRFALALHIVFRANAVTVERTHFRKGLCRKLARISNFRRATDSLAGLPLYSVLPVRYPRGPRGRSAKPLFVGSNPTRTSSIPLRNRRLTSSGFLCATGIWEGSGTRRGPDFSRRAALRHGDRNDIGFQDAASGLLGKLARHLDEVRARLVKLVPP